MQNTQKILMNLIKSEICAVPFDCNDELVESNLNSLYTLSKKHDMTQIIVSPLERMSALKPEYSVTEKFKKTLFTAIYRYEKSNFELGKIVEIFAEEGIDHLPLKGAYIRSYYHKPYLRTSCDVDILVKREDVQRATEVLTTRLNYKYESKERYDVSLFTPSGVHIELHFGLVEDIFKDSKPLNEIWQGEELIEVSPHRFEMSHEMFLFYHIYHMAKHFVHGGCGIKPFIDLWIIRNKIGYDSERAEKLLSDNGFLEFYKKALTLSEIWFDGKEYTDIAKDMEDYILQGGVYGTLEQHLAMSQGKKGGKLGHLMSKIFLPYRTMVIYYPSLEKYPILFPLYQVRRWFRIAFCGGGKRALNEIKLNQNLSNLKQEKAKKLLSELGL